MTDNWEEFAATAREAERNVRASRSAIRQTFGAGIVGIFVAAVGIFAPNTVMALGGAAIVAVAVIGIVVLYRAQRRVVDRTGRLLMHLVFTIPAAIAVTLLIVGTVKGEVAVVVVGAILIMLCVLGWVAGARLEQLNRPKDTR